MLLNKIFDWMDRAKSRIYAIYIFWLLVGFLPVLFVSLFVDQQLLYEKTKLLKNEYIRDEFFNFSTWQGVVYPIAVIIGASIMTRLVIWDFPKLFVNKAYKREIESQFQRDFEQIKIERKLEAEKQLLAEEQLDTVEKEKAIASEQEKIEKTETEKWMEEYSELKKKQRLFNYFSEIPEAIFDYGGRIEYQDQNEHFKIDTNLLSYAHASNLVSFDDTRTYISLTEKGKFFLKNYELEK